MHFAARAGVIHSGEAAETRWEGGWRAKKRQDGERAAHSREKFSQRYYLASTHPAAEEKRHVFDSFSIDNGRMFVDNSPA